MTKETEEQKKNREMIEDIAVNITQLSRQVSALLTGRLKRKSLVILLSHSAKMSQYQVESVLTAITNLEKDHIK